MNETSLWTHISSHPNAETYDVYPYLEVFAVTSLGWGNVLSTCRDYKQISSDGGAVALARIQKLDWWELFFTVCTFDYWNHVAFSVVQ